MESEGGREILDASSPLSLPSSSFLLFSTATQKTTVNILTSRVPAKAQNDIYFKVKRKQF